MSEPIILLCYVCHAEYDFLAADDPSLMLCRPCLNADPMPAKAVKVKQLPLL